VRRGRYDRSHGGADRSHGAPTPGATLAPTPDPTPAPTPAPTLAPTPEPTPAPVRTPPRATIPVPTAVRSTPAPSASFVAIPAAIIQTPWGRAWDRSPAGFPLPSDAQAADPGDPTQGPSSAVYVSGQAVNLVVTIVEQGIRSLGLTVEGIAEGEDGSVAIGLVGTPAACRAQVVVRPLGSTTFITVYYGSRCARP